MKNIAVLVLAAGKSSRMKSIKQLEKIGNKTLLELTLEKAKQLPTKNIFCVLGANANLIKSKIKTEKIDFIINNNFNEGLSSSIVSGIDHFKKNHFEFDGVLVLLADQPAIEFSYLNTLISLFNADSSKIIASNYGDFFGVPALFSSKYFDDLLLIKGDKGAKKFINQSTKNIISPKIKANLVDIDTKQDLDSYNKSI